MDSVGTVARSTTQAGVQTLRLEGYGRAVELNADRGDSMDTPSDMTRRLQADGYTANLYAGEDRMLRCDEWPEPVDPSTVAVDQRGRFEGQSDPGDEVILFAVTTQDGYRGIYTAAFTSQTPPEDVAIIRVLGERA